MTIRRSMRRVSSLRLAEVARGLLDDSTLCALSTISPGGRAHVNAVYFAWDYAFRLIWISERGARHSRNLAANASAALTVYDSNQRWGRPDRGIQLFGTAREPTGGKVREAEAVYARRFPAYERGELSAYALYVFRPSRLKVFDETTLGSGAFVTARVRRGGALEWERTELYSGSA